MNKQRLNYFLMIIAIFIVLVLSSCDATQTLESIDNETKDATETDVMVNSNANELSEISADALSPFDLTYLGGFLLPDDGDIEQEMFS